MCKIDQINPSGGCDTKPTRSLGWFGNAAGALGMTASSTAVDVFRFALNGFLVSSSLPARKKTPYGSPGKIRI